jgi:hypothetical protein
MAAEADLSHYLSKAYHTLMADPTFPGVVREAVKDIRSTIMEVFFSKPERGSEPGTPLNPLFSDLVQARNHHRSILGSMNMPPQANQDVPSVSEILSSPQAFLSPQQGLGNAYGQQMAEGMSNTAAPAAPDAGVPSVSEILDNPQAYQPPEQQQGQSQQQPHGMSM